MFEEQYDNDIFHDYVHKINYESEDETAAAAAAAVADNEKKIN